MCLILVHAGCRGPGGRVRTSKEYKMQICSDTYPSTDGGLCRAPTTNIYMHAGCRLAPNERRGCKADHSASTSQACVCARLRWLRLKQSAPTQ
eukprot:2001929-Prymnesium_polylepis.1